LTTAVPEKSGAGFWICGQLLSFELSVKLRAHSALLVLANEPVAATN